ncbi:MAG: Bifunctional purine biosynthesis protein PurH [candidate division WS2 bacterium]|nr:Bifunctional purine biosynthesis protein PurH [Candidatus Lithacetigena glycinireducens]
MKNKFALLSVSDKIGLVEFARDLVDLGFTIISTGGTKKTLSEAGVPVKQVSEITGFPEILGGRVKTLHPKIHGGILACRDSAEHIKELAEHHINLIDLVAVNLYPFAQTVNKAGVTLEEAIENIDIGGPTMVRAAAKNYRDVVVVVNPDRYGVIIQELKEKGEISYETRFSLAVEAFTHTAEYDAVIRNWLKKKYPESEMFPPTVILPLTRLQKLRYGENPQQEAAFYGETSQVYSGLSSAIQLQGKDLSYNNFNDASAALQLVMEFAEPTAVAIKHANPCGVASAGSISEAFWKAYEADKVSIFGGIVAVNRNIDIETARQMKDIFLEVVLAPVFDEEALTILNEKKNLRLLKINKWEKCGGVEIKSIQGGFLLQEMDVEDINTKDWKCPTLIKPDERTLEDMVFGMKVVKHTKSNAIVLVKDRQTLGVGAGQMNRVGSARIALEQAGEKAKGCVLASDAFFPFRDVIDEAYKVGVTGIVQPGGSLRDEDSIKACDEHGITMMITGRRYFKH